MDEFYPEGDLHVDLYVRSDLPRPAERRADSMDAELQALQAEGDVSAYDRHTWDKRVRVGACSSAVRDRYLTFSAWAERAGVTLQPFFDTRERYNTETETYTDCIVVPAMTLAVTVDEEVVAVYPHADGDETVSVEDGVAAIRADDVPPEDRSLIVAD